MQKTNDLDSLRHSCAHLLAKAVLELWPGSYNAIGPSIENGFYQDFDLGNIKISESDLPKIEKKMREILPSWTHFEFNEVTLQEAEKLFKHNPYKLELAKEFASEGRKLTTNNPGGFLDLCKMKHVENPAKELRYFKLLSIAGAYWRGSEKNKMLTRIYGTCFPTKKELDEYLWQQEEAKKRDHRKIGKDLDLFLISENIGGGLPIFTPKGTMLRELIENYIVSVKKKAGYQFVWTPHIARAQIYKISGHLGKYDAMFSPMKLNEEDYILKPMNCPHHFQVYLSRPRSYKELPMYIAENGTVYREEKSGELSGLFRVRSLTIDDTHAIVRVESIHEELAKVINLIKKVLQDFGFKKFKARISTSDAKNQKKYIGPRRDWKKAETALKETAKKVGLDYEIGVGEAAFYGPKIDVMIKDSLGREWQLSTVQLDYQQPRNFNLMYTDKNGFRQPTAVLHIAMIGSIERFMGILIEHYSGKFPLWLSPVQVMIIPIADRHIKYASSIVDTIKLQRIRVELDSRQETVGSKIRDATLQKVPYVGIIGDNEISNIKYQKSKRNAAISVRTRKGKDLGQIKLSQFLNKLKEEIDKKI